MPASHWGLDEKVQRARQWHKDRIKRFVRRQRRDREYINFAEIAEWCAKEDQSILPNEQKRAAAYDTLERDLLAGEFNDENGKSRVLYLNPMTTKARMTREWLQDAIEYNYDGKHGRSAFLPCCWMPRSMFVRWLATHRLGELPPRFQPQKSHRVPVATSAKISDETAAIKMLERLLEENNNLKFVDALSACRKEYSLSERGFRYRIWPKARKAARLSPMATPGRKRQKS
jgi:hypothetical protein